MTNVDFYMSTNFRDDCDFETKSLGEVFPYIAAAEQKLNEARELLEKVQRGDSQDADTAASELIEAIDTARHNTAWRHLLAAAEDAFTEARVVPIRSAA